MFIRSATGGFSRHLVLSAELHWVRQFTCTCRTQMERISSLNPLKYFMTVPNVYSWALLIIQMLNNTLLHFYDVKKRKMNYFNDFLWNCHKGLSFLTDINVIDVFSVSPTPFPSISLSPSLFISGDEAGE